LFRLGILGDGYTRIELELDIRSLVPRCPIKCRGEIEEMMKVDIKKVVGAF